MENIDRKEYFESLVESYDQNIAQIGKMKKDKSPQSANYEGMYLVSEMGYLKNYLGDNRTKLFTIGENNMSLDELRAEKGRLEHLILQQGLAENPEFSDDVYSMMESMVKHIYNSFVEEREVMREKVENMGKINPNSKFTPEKVAYIEARARARDYRHKQIKAYENNQEIDSKPEKTDRTDRDAGRYL